MMQTLIFEDRVQAGKLLAERLKKYATKDSVVLAIPRGGVVVGYEIAKELDIPLDVVIIKKLGAPGNPELAIGAVTRDGATYINRKVAEMVGADEWYIRNIIEKKLEEVVEREKIYRSGRPPVDIADKNVIIVDDGVATGSTLIAAIRALRGQNPGKMISAIPVVPPDVVEQIDDVSDETIYLMAPDIFFAVGQFYHRFEQTTDDEVVELLKKSEDFGKNR
jgi:putative phosphoribosyl transferase